MTGISHPPTDNARTQLEAYIDGWRRHDIPAVLETLTDDCVVIESYGPVYRGKGRVEQWMNAWFGAGGTVDACTPCTPRTSHHPHSESRTARAASPVVVSGPDYCPQLPTPRLRRRGSTDRG